MHQSLRGGHIQVWARHVDWVTDTTSDKNGHLMTESTSRPQLIVFDVNETLSDMRPLADAFAATGAPEHLAATWFAGLLRDGFALTVTGQNPAFSLVASSSLRAVLHGVVTDLDGAVEHVMAGFSELPLHRDVVGGVRALRDLGITLVTLSNGAAAVAEGLFERNGIADAFERILSVQDGDLWKPAAAAYDYALRTCGVNARDAMLVAVHPWDIHGAHEAGLATGWLSRDGGPYPAYYAAPDVEASSLTDLATQLDAMKG